MFETRELEVDALVVDAFEIAKLDELPNSVEIVPLVAVRFVKTAVSALMKVENRLVDDAFVIVPFVDERFVLEIFVAERLVVVAFPTTSVVSVAFPASISTLEIFVFARFVVPVAFRSVVFRIPSCEV